MLLKEIYMPEKTPKAKYKCSQPEFYSTAKLAWDSFEINIADFTNFSTLYTPAFLAARRQQWADAKAMPDVQARGDAGETYGIQLEQAAKDANLKWLLLRRYIEKSYKGPMAKP